MARPLGEVLLYQPSLVGLPTASGEPEYVRNQLTRGSCTMFSAVAAMEYVIWKRTGRVVDLSEQFTGHIGKVAYLHPYFPDIIHPWTVENQLGGSNGGEFLGPCFDGLPMVAETATMPYSDPVFSPPFGDPFWDNQFNVNWHNFVNLPTSLLNRPLYYQALGFKRVAPANDPVTIQKVFETGYPVSWDFFFAGDTTGEIWLPGEPSSGPGHSMLIVGFNNTGATEDDKFFYVKNSWGATPYAYGLTKVSYSYLRMFGLQARTINNVMETTSNYSVMGRWGYFTKSDADVLDISHIPGTAKQNWTYWGVPDQEDYRLGAIYSEDAAPPASDVWRVNGSITPQGVALYYSTSEANIPYWRLLSGSDRQGWLGKVGHDGMFMAGFSQNGSTDSGVLAAKTILPFATPGSATTVADLTGRYRIVLGRRNQGNLQIAPVVGLGVGESMVAATIEGVEYRGTVRLGSPLTLFTSGPFPIDTPMWMFTLRKVGSTTTIRFAGSQVRPGEMMFGGLVEDRHGFLLRRVADL